jgi:sulfatase maturation enzyme AslB (radical SAM superfamily)
MLNKIKHRIRKNPKLRQAYQSQKILRYTIKHKFGIGNKLGIGGFHLDRRISEIKRRYYVAYFIDLRCNYRCSYCIQDDINRREYDKTSVDRVIHYLKTEVKPRETNLTIIGGEPTLSADFSYVVESLCNDFYITITTNLSTRFYKDFDGFIEWAKKVKIRWNVSYHPEFMDIDFFIARVKKIQEAKLEMDQVSAVKNDILSEADRNKLENAGIGFTYQSALGIDKESGELLPKTDSHPDFNYERYQEMCGKQIKETRKCKTVDYDGHARHLISSDGTIYNCHHLLYKEKHPIGHIDNGWPENILDVIICGEYGHCNPCDFRDMEVLPADNSIYKPVTLINT